MRVRARDCSPTDKEAEIISSLQIRATMIFRRQKACFPLHVAPSSAAVKWRCRAAAAAAALDDLSEEQQTAAAAAKAYSTSTPEPIQPASLNPILPTPVPSHLSPHHH